MIKTTQAIQIPFLKEPGHQVTFKNGHTLIFVPKRGEVFNLSTWVKTGSIHEDQKNNGVSHFLEHLMFKGTKRFKPGEFDRIMESMGAVINAATWKDFTFYYITGPKGPGGQCFATALDLHADMLIHSTLPDEEIGPEYNPDDPDYAGEKRERSVVIEEIGMRNDQPWTKVYNSVNHMMYPATHPYQWDVIGTRQIIGHIPRESILDYYQRWYSPSTMTTIVVGDFELDSVTAQVSQAFDFSTRDAVHAGQTPPPLYDKNKAPAVSSNGKRFETITGDYQTSFFIMGFHGPDSANLQESIALDIASYVLGEGRSSRMTQELLEKPATPVFNAVSCGQSTFKLGNVFFIQGNFAGISTDDALAQVQTELKKLLDTHPITEDEFRRAVKKFKVDFAETSETATGISETIGESVTVVGDLASYTQYLEALAKLDCATVQAVAQKYCQPERAYTSVLVPA